ncbi:MAG: glycosyltransferase family 4 protein [Sphingomonadales bacterium]|nr:glycosyltransferase family 4 protein [Sphingomonadales bacterium]MBD3774785.1 glycosyltransferase family 4 protein [Paracoccaceae bacterium]
MRVGFIFSDRKRAWMGGVNYLRNLFLAFATAPETGIEPVLLVPPDMVEDARGEFADTGVTVLACPYVEGRGLAKTAGVALKRLIGHDPLFAGWLKRHGIALLSHRTTLGRGSAVPSIAWIPDFQHLVLPELYTEEVRTRRDRAFRRMAQQSDAMIVSSEDARGNLAAFLPQAADKAHVLHFVADMAVEGAVSRAELEETYGFSGPFFFLPNQFWAHKNHAAAIRALGLLRAAGEPVLVLASGNVANKFDPAHIDRVHALIEECGVADDFRLVGLVPRSHLLALMRDCVALINPSRFEGWSSTVEEARTLGKRVILSDIPVHREQAPPRADYFAPDSPEELADAMRRALSEWDPVAESSHAAAARADFSRRQKEFAREYRAIVDCVLAGRGQLESREA